MQAKYAIKVQVVRSKAQAPRFHVNFPLPLAAAIGLEGGEEVQWELLDRGELRLVRPHAPPPRRPYRSGGRSSNPDTLSARGRTAARAKSSVKSGLT